MDAGTPIHVQLTKWRDRPHWQFEAVMLGTDEWGTWLGIPEGTFQSRPGHSFHSEVDSVLLVPDDDWYLACFHAPGVPLLIYTDISTPATFSGSTMTAVDLDLDVIRMVDSFDGLREPKVGVGPGDMFIDDEDEFLEHQVRYEYPADVVREARRSADEVLAKVQERAAPFGGQHQVWLDRLAEFTI